MTRKVLILGGYGSFGGRLARLLAGEPDLTLVLAGRSKAKAEAFRAALPDGAQTEAARVDRDGDVVGAFMRHAPDIVVDASGPFQGYGEDAYRVVRAALAAGANYLDLADGTDFVRGIAVLDAAAKRRGKFVLTGLSTFPALTAAVVRRLAADLEHVDSIAAGIAPTPYAGLGASVTRAIAGYAGKPVPVRRGGATGTGYPLAETRRYTVAPPGRMPLDPLRFSLVDVPDLTLLAELWPGVRSVWVGAAPTPPVAHAALRLLAHAVRLRLLPSLTPLAPFLHFMSKLLVWGEHRGGMFVDVDGRAPGGAAVRRSWHLLAEVGDGPLIPSMAAEAVIRNWLAGKSPEPGARAALREVELADYERSFAHREIYTGIRTTQRDPDAPLYGVILGDAWQGLPQPIRDMHGAVETTATAGRARVEWGPSWAARMIATLLRLPRPADDVEVSVEFERANGVETWRRTFGEQRFVTVQYEGRGRFEGLLCERFGPFVFGIALVANNGRLDLAMRRWSLFGIPLPRRLAPRGWTFEEVDNGRFRFHVEIALSLVGLVIHYQGTLDAPQPAPSGRFPHEP